MKKHTEKNIQNVSNILKISADALAKGVELVKQVQDIKWEKTKGKKKNARRTKKD